MNNAVDPQKPDYEFERSFLALLIEF